MVIAIAFNTNSLSSMDKLAHIFYYVEFSYPMEFYSVLLPVCFVMVWDQEENCEWVFYNFLVQHKGLSDKVVFMWQL